MNRLRVAVVVAAAAMAPTFVSTACIPARTAATVVSVIDRVADAVQYLDAAWSVLCAVSPSTCERFGESYQTHRGRVLAALIASRDATDAASTGSEADLRRAYESLEDFLVKVGAIRISDEKSIDNSSGRAPTRQPWAAPNPFGSRR